MSAEASAAAKQSLRTSVRAARRRGLGTRDRTDDAEALATAVLALLRDRNVAPGSRVAAYESRPTEPPTDRLVEALTEAGYEVVVPLTRPDLDLDWCVASDPERRPLGVRAISAAAVVLAPGLAADRSGNRLGQGGGSYDRTLGRREAGAPVVVLLYDDEVLPEGAVPVQAHDVRVDVAVTPGGGAVSLHPAD